MRYSLFASPIECSLTDPQFNFLIGWQVQFLESVKFLAEENNNLSKKYYSHAFEKNFPFSQGNNLDKIDYSSVFYGALGKKYTLVYKEMLQLWKDLQEETINNNYQVDNYSERIRKILDHLVSLVHI